MKAVSVLIVVLCCAAGARAQDAVRQAATFKTDGKLTWAAFSPDGRLLAVSYGEKTSVRLLDARTGGLLAKLEGQDDPLGTNLHSSFVGRVTLGPASTRFSRDGRLLAVTAYRANQVRVWDVQAGKLSLTLRGLTNVREVSFSPDGNVLAVAAGDQGLRLVDLVKGALLDPHWDARSVRSVNAAWFLQDGKTIAVYTSNLDEPKRRLYLIDLETGRVESRVGGGRGGGDSYIAYVSKGAGEFATVGEDGDISLWETATGRLLRSLKLKGGKGYPPVEFGPGARTLALPGPQGGVAVWDFEHGQVLATLPLAEKDGFLGYKADEPSLLLTSTKQGIKLWDPLTLAPRGEMKGARPPLAFSRDGRAAVTAGAGDTAILWDTSGL
jgi:WD40 repeat protein